MKIRILYKNITKLGIFIVYIVYVLWRKKTSKQTNTHFEILGYFSQQIFFQKQKVAGMNLFVWTSWKKVQSLFESERRERRVGGTVLDIMSWDRKTGHCIGFIRITLTLNICFGRDLLHLKVDILSFLYIYFSCIWGEYSRRFRLFYLRVCEERWQSRCPDILSYPSDFPTGAYCACAHQYFVLFLMLNNNI